MRARGSIGEHRGSTGGACGGACGGVAYRYIIGEPKLAALYPAIATHVMPSSASFYKFQEIAGAVIETMSLVYSSSRRLGSR